jgi:hypothetical protein
MKLYSLLLPLVAIAPILSISLPAQSQPDRATNISQIDVNQQIQPPQIDNRPQIQLPINEVIDFGTYFIGTQQIQGAKKLGTRFILPPGHSTFSVTAEAPFAAFANSNGQIDSNREGIASVVVNPSTLAVGNHEKIMTIKSDRNLILKRVLLKIKINPPVSNAPNGPRPEQRP